MKSSEALRAIRPLIESGQERYLCLALKYKLPRDYSQLPVYRRIERATEGRSIDVWLLWNSMDYVDWYYARRFPRSEKAQAYYKNQMRLYRLRWIDWMIEGYERAGD